MGLTTPIKMGDLSKLNLTFQSQADYYASLGPEAYAKAKADAVANAQRVAAEVAQYGNYDHVNFSDLSHWVTDDLNSAKEQLIAYGYPPDQANAATWGSMQSQWNANTGNRYENQSSNDGLGGLGNAVSGAIGGIGDAIGNTVSSVSDFAAKNPALAAAILAVATDGGSLLTEGALGEGAALGAGAEASAGTAAAEAAAADAAAAGGASAGAGGLGAGAATGVGAAGAGGLGAAAAPSTIPAALIPSDAALTNTGINAGLQAAQGKNVGDIAKGAALSLASGAVGSNVAAEAAPTIGQTAANIVGQGAGTAAVGAVTGASPDQIVKSLEMGGLSAAVGAIASQVPGYDSMTSAQKAGVNAAVSTELATSGNTQAALTAGLTAMGSTAIKNEIKAQQADQRVTDTATTATAQTPTPAQQDQSNQSALDAIAATPTEDQVKQDVGGLPNVVDVPAQDSSQTTNTSALDAVAPTAPVVETPAPVAPPAEVAPGITQDMVNEATNTVTNPAQTPQAPSGLDVAAMVTPSVTDAVQTATEDQSGGLPFTPQDLQTATETVTNQPAVDTSPLDLSSFVTPSVTDAVQEATTDQTGGLPVSQPDLQAAVDTVTNQPSVESQVPPAPLSTPAVTQQLQDLGIIPAEPETPAQPESAPVTITQPADVAQEVTNPPLDTSTLVTPDLINQVMGTEPPAEPQGNLNAAIESVTNVPPVDTSMPLLSGLDTLVADTSQTSSDVQQNEGNLPTDAETVTTPAGLPDVAQTSPEASALDVLTADPNYGGEPTPDDLIQQASDVAIEQTPTAEEQATSNQDVIQQLIDTAPANVDQTPTSGLPVSADATSADTGGLPASDPTSEFLQSIGIDPSTVTDTAPASQDQVDAYINGDSAVPVDVTQTSENPAGGLQEFTNTTPADTSTSTSENDLQNFDNPVLLPNDSVAYQQPDGSLIDENANPVTDTGEIITEPTAKESTQVDNPIETVTSPENPEQTGGLDALTPSTSDLTGGISDPTQLGGEYGVDTTNPTDNTGGLSNQTDLGGEYAVDRTTPSSVADNLITTGLPTTDQGAGPESSEGTATAENTDNLIQQASDLAVAQTPTPEQQAANNQAALDELPKNNQIITTPVTPTTVVPKTPKPTVAPTAAPISTTSQTTQQLLNSLNKFIDVKDPFLKIGKSSKKSGLQQEALHQLFDKLDPNLQSVMSDRGSAPSSEGDSVPAAKGGSIHGIHNMLSPELQAIFASRVPGYADGGTTSTMQSVMDMLAPKLVKQSPLFFKPSGERRAPVELAKLTQLKDAPKLGGLAQGGLPAKYEKAAPKGHNPEFITGLTGYYAGGRGTGQSDDIPAMLHEGDYVIDADAVSALGDGSSKAGRDALMHFMHQVPHRSEPGGKPIPAKIADGEMVFPESFVTALGGGDNKRGAKLLDEMRENLREHKRSAPTSKIPPKAKSPLDYLKMAKG